MLIETWCKITIGSVPLLAEGDWVEGEMVPPARDVEVQTFAGMRQGFKDRVGRGLIEHRFSFRMARLMPTHLDAWYLAMNHVTNLPIQPAVLLIEGLAGGKWTLSRAMVISPYRPSIRANLFQAEYEIVGSIFTCTEEPPVPDPDHPPAPFPDTLLNPDNSVLINPDGSPLVNPTN